MTGRMAWRSTLAVAGIILILGAAACTSKANAVEQATPKDAGAMMDKKDDSMAKSDATMEKKDAAMRGDSMTDKKDDAMMDKKDDSMVKSDATMEKKDAAMRSDSMTDKKDDAMMDQKLPDQRISAHFVSSTPKHGEALMALPDKLALQFDFTLNPTSAISITKDGAPVAVGAPEYDGRSLMMATALPKTAGNGLYVVKYKACWPDNSCHDGQFAFTVKSN